MHQLTKVAIQAVRENPECRAALQLELECSNDSIKRYLRLNDPLLTTYTALLVIETYTGLPPAKAIEGELKIKS